MSRRSHVDQGVRRGERGPSDIKKVLDFSSRVRLAKARSYLNLQKQKLYIYIYIIQWVGGPVDRRMGGESEGGREGADRWMDG